MPPTFAAPRFSAVRSRLNRSVVVCLLAGVVIAQAAMLGLQAARNLSQPFGAVDWWTYFSSVSMLQVGQGHLLYNVSSLTAFQHSLGRTEAVVYPYHPAFLLLTYPFVALGPALSYLAWLLFNLLLLACCLMMLANTLVERTERALFFLLVLASLPVYIALLVGQSSFVVLMGLTLLILGVLQRSDVRTAAGMVVLLIKPQYLPIWLVLLLWQRRFKSLAYFAAGGLMILALSYLMVGASGLRDYARLLVSGPLPGAYPLSHTLNGLAQNVTQSAAAMPIYLLSSALVVGLYLFLLRRTSHHSDQRVLVAITILVSMLVANYLVIYDLTIWGVLLALLWPLAKRGKGRYLVAAALFAPWITQAAAQSGVGFVWPTVGLELTALALLYARVLQPSHVAAHGSDADSAAAAAIS